MGRPARFIPENKDGVLVEVTARTIGARALLVPSPDPRRFNEAVIGVMGRALEVSPLELCSAVWTANHYHCLLVVRDQQQLSRFMHHLGCNISKEIGGRIRKWRGAFWERRYDGIVVSGEPEAQWQRLKYHLSHSVKEGLCESPLQWPGVHAAKALVHGELLEGYWFSRSKAWAAENRGQDVGRYDFATRYLVGFSPLPAFRHLPPEEYKDRVAGLIREIEEEGERKRDGNPVAGTEKIFSQNPYEPPTRRTKRSSKPLFHVASRQAREDLRQEILVYLAQYWEASQALRRGNLKAADWFPAGCYPPAFAFVGQPPPRRTPPPPTRRIEILESGDVERGDIPVVEIVGVFKTADVLPPETLGTAEPRARGQPP
ncbi:MAG: hypothetical protein GY719_05795 [bacterium]|nr:hypothetical protein [bacterium]